MEIFLGSNSASSHEEMTAESACWIESVRKRTEVHDELEFYQEHEGFRLEEKHRKKKFDAIVEQMRASYEIETGKILENRIMAFYALIRDKGIEQTREEMVPAYRFKRFSELPLEIRDRIWCLAIRVSEPQARHIATMDLDSDNRHRHYFESSRIYGYYRDNPSPTNVLHACRESRAIGVKTYSRMSVQLITGSLFEAPARWINMHDSFYMIGGRWSRFKILVDILNSASAPTFLLIKKGLDTFANINFLNVDLRVFASAPQIVWTHFKKLEVLTIGIHAVRETVDDDHYMFEELRFLKIMRGGSCEKRALWLQKATMERLASVYADTPGCAIPSIHMRIMSTWDEVSESTYGLGWSESRYCNGNPKISPDDFMNDSQTMYDNSTFDRPEDDREWYLEVSRLLEIDSSNWKEELEIANMLISSGCGQESRREMDLYEEEEEEAHLQRELASFLEHEENGLDSESDTGEF